MSKSWLWAGMGLFAASLASHASAAVIYTQSFNNPTAANQPLTYLNSGANTWSSYQKGTALTPSPFGTDTWTYPVLSGSQFLFVQSSSPELSPVLVYVNGTFNTVAQAESATFDVRNVTSSVPVRFAIRVETTPGSASWYATQATFTSATNTTWESKSVNFASAAWNSVTVNPGVSLAMGSAATLPAGTVTGLGWFNAAGVDNWRVDNFTYSAAVPEPATLSLLLVGAVGILARRR